MICSSDVAKFLPNTKTALLNLLISASGKSVNVAIRATDLTVDSDTLPITLSSLPNDSANASTAAAPPA